MGTVPQQPSQPVILPWCLPLRQTEEVVERSPSGQLPGTPVVCDRGFAAYMCVYVVAISKGSTHGGDTDYSLAR